MSDVIGFSQDEIIAAIRTARAAGAVGRNAIVPRYLAEHFPAHMQVLDFGSGAGRVHQPLLESHGFEYHHHDFAAPNPDALAQLYDVAMLSNVLNIQLSLDMLTRTIRQVVGCLKPAGVLLANYPASPRKVPALTAGDMAGILARHFIEVVQVGGTTSAPLYRCQGFTVSP